MQNYSDNVSAYGVHDGSTESSKSGVFWSAILAGAFAATAVSLVLGLLGSGLGFAFAPNPTDYSYGAGDHPVAAFTVWAAIWLLVTQWLSSALGGYLAGRLRTKWVGLHTDEVFFRDTAHGFTAWAVASVIVAAFAVSTASGVMKTGADVANSAMVASAASDDSRTSMDPTDMYVDHLYRTGSATPDTVSDRNLRAETKRLLVRNVGQDFSADDRSYLTSLVASRAEIARGNAEARVNDVLAQKKADEDKAREAAEDARKAAARFALFTVLAMLVGAFIASAAAALGGLHRDEVDTVAITSTN